MVMQLGTFQLNSSKSGQGLDIGGKVCPHLACSFTTIIWVLLLLDGLEDQRPLSTLEKRFRRLVKEYLSTLIESRRIFWKQRNTIRWVNLGDENTSIFHNMATISHKKNFITCLSIHGDSVIFDHDQKVQILWDSFRKRMGV